MQFAAAPGIGRANSTPEVWDILNRKRRSGPAASFWEQGKYGPSIYQNNTTPTALGSHAIGGFSQWTLRFRFRWRAANIGRLFLKNVSSGTRVNWYITSGGIRLVGVNSLTTKWDVTATKTWGSGSKDWWDILWQHDGLSGGGRTQVLANGEPLPLTLTTTSDYIPDSQSLGWAICGTGGGAYEKIQWDYCSWWFGRLVPWYDDIWLPHRRARSSVFFVPVSGHTITALSSTHGHTAGTVTLTQTHSVDATSTEHAHTVQSSTVSQTHVVEASGTEHAHTAGTATVSSTHTVSATSSEHANTASAATVTQTHVIAASNAEHTHTVDAATLTQTHVVVATDTQHGHTADTASITQTHVVVATNVQHAHTVATATISQVVTVAALGATHGHTAGFGTLTQQHVVSVSSALHGLTSSAAAITQTHVIAVTSAIHSHTVDNVTLTLGELSALLGDIYVFPAVKGTVMIYAAVLGETSCNST